MDTRSKIVASSEVPRDGHAIVIGYFDPLLVSHAVRLMEIRKSHEGLAVVIKSPKNPVLPAPARAELVAALACVDYVVLDEVPQGVVYREESVDEERFRQLVEHVQRRHQAR